LVGLSLLAAVAFAAYARQKIKGFTGDTLGFQNEAVEIVALLCCLLT